MADSKFHPQSLGGGGLPIAQSSKSVPPGWSEKFSYQYPFKKWKRDLLMWASTTDLDHMQIGPAMVLRLDGVSREIGNYMAEQAELSWRQPILKSALAWHHPI